MEGMQLSEEELQSTLKDRVRRNPPPCTSEHCEVAETKGPQGSRACREGALPADDSAAPRA